jgi:sphingomyelin phosphodiesterase acid-like 3
MRRAWLAKSDHGGRDYCANSSRLVKLAALREERRNGLGYSALMMAADDCRKRTESSETRTDAGRGGAGAGGRPGLWMVLVFLLPMTPWVSAESGRRPADSKAPAVTAVFLSDLHFDPFYDPGKVAQLAGAPASAWKAILGAPASEGREAKFASLIEGCHARGEDSSFALFESSLKAARLEAAKPKISGEDAAGAALVTVSGDLIAHSFDCKFKTLVPHAEAGQYEQFVEKTLAFVMAEVRAVAPGRPAYVALGNNDSACGDYRLDAHSEFLKAVGEQVALGVPEAERKSVAESFAAYGGYSARLPEPIAATRLLVLDDIFLSNKYQSCAGKPDRSAGDAQLAWLESELALARQRHERVWVMGHIPPGVDVYTSARHMDTLCGAKGPSMFLSSERLASVISAYGDVVKLAIFGHTHMDELRVLRGDDSAGVTGPDARPSQPGHDGPGVEPGAGPGAGTGVEPGVAMKIVSSVSPISGNTPSFTVARIHAGTAELKDYEVFAASNTSGVSTAWKEEYDWGKAFHASAFNAASASKEIAGFAGDPEARTDESKAYIGDFTVGASPLLSIVWPQYVCALKNDGAEAYKACVCQTAK